MGSLNGDIMVIRNGRSTSQISVYNYPEHLNPFYEDDQHKRLRFWKISKKDNEGRRNSFSIGNLKDMWAFKSFRTKKKSSTLGINKTSESPPILRRDYIVNNGWNTFDHRLRATNTSSMNGDNFQRNATYRSSLQTLPTNNDRFGLNRNDGYRSTIQVTGLNHRYQPKQKQHLQQQQPITGVSQHNRRPSQSSMVSSNPFESDDDENENINSSGIRSVNGGSTTTLTSRTPRKKRKAPAPPTPIRALSPPTIRIESSHDSTQDELCIKEDVDIANLTAEIENFVKTKSNDDVEIKLNNEVQTTNEIESKTTMMQTSSENAKQEKVKQNEITSTKISDIPLENKKTKPAAKANGQISTEILTVRTTITNTNADATKPLDKETTMAKDTSELVTNTDESKEIKTNGAIPKKPNNNIIISNTSTDQQQHVETERCLKQANTGESPQKPIPLKRQTKPEEEFGHVECIHVHVESPRPSPRKDHTSGVSSFKKTTETVESYETITTKTPFVLTSPPTQKKKPQQTESEPVLKETVKLVGSTAMNTRTNELNIKEERIIAKPEIAVKPTLSPKPVSKEVNGKIHGFAEIHKPVRKFTNSQNGYVRKASRDESIPSPTVPQQAPKEEERKINNLDPLQNTKISKIKEKLEAKPVDSLKIVETVTSSNGVLKNTERAQDKEEKKTNIENSIKTSTITSSNENHNELQKRDDEFELLYRPKPTSHMEWKRSTLAPLETHIPPEKRKSVKDIIESINRSQRLLNAAANKDFPALQTQTAAASENLKNLDKRQQEIHHLVNEVSSSISHTTSAGEPKAVVNSPSPTPSNYNNECAEAQKVDNNAIFQKCKVKKEVYDYRESSPISSNLDWNPVPKPKRTKPGQE